MEIFLSPLLFAGATAITYCFWRKYGGTAYLWSLRLWIIYTIWLFCEHVFDAITDLSPKAEQFENAISLTASILFLILFSLIQSTLFIENRKYWRFISRIVTPYGIGSLFIVIFATQSLFLQI